MQHSPGQQLTLAEAVSAFENLPPALQIASLHPGMVQVDANRDLSLTPVYWRYADGPRQWLHSFHLGTAPGLTVLDVQSAYGYGGPLANTNDPGFVRDAHAAFTCWAKAQGVVAEFIRLHPMLQQQQWYMGQLSHNRDTVYVDLDQDLFEQYQVRRRTDVRRFMESGLRAERVAPDVMYAEFPSIYQSNMDQVGADASYYFSARYFEALFHSAWVDNWLIYANHQAVAGAVFLKSEQARIAEYHLSARLAEFEHFKSTPGLIHLAASYYQSAGYHAFYLGGGRSRDPGDSLLFFKKGFSRMTRPYFIGTEILDPEQYRALEMQYPEKARSGRVLFYKD